jgi:hypothetical protein
MFNIFAAMTYYRKTQKSHVLRKNILCENNNWSDTQYCMRIYAQTQIGTSKISACGILSEHSAVTMSHKTITILLYYKYFKYLNIHASSLQEN